MTEAKRRENAEKFIAWMIESRRGLAVMPAVGAGLVIGGEVVATQVVGVRKWGTNHKAKRGDLFPIGSITKPLTGLLLARMIDDGVVRWGTTIGDVYPDLIAKLRTDEVLPGIEVPLPSAAWANHYRDTSVVDLMTHTSGLDYAPRNPAEEQRLGLFDMPAGSTPHRHLVAKRKLYTRLAIEDEPFEGEGWTNAPGKNAQKYSGGCIVVASMLEKRDGQPWEQLMTRYVFNPLGIKAYSFGEMSKPNKVTDNWFHWVAPEGVTATAKMRTTQIAYTHSPAGSVCISVGDFGKLVAALCVNPNGFLVHNTWSTYMTRHPTAIDFTRGGWIGDNGVIAHDGSNGWYYATAHIDTTAQVGAYVFCTSGQPAVPPHLWDIRDEMRHMGKAWDLFGHVDQAVPASAMSFRSTSTRAASGGATYSAVLMNDPWLRTGWRSGVATEPKLTIKFDGPRKIRGFVLYQPEAGVIESFDISFGTRIAARPKVGQASKAGHKLGNVVVRSRNGHVIRVVFPKAVTTRKLEIHIRNPSGKTTKPAINRLIVLKG